MLKFDDDTAKLLETAYLGADFRRRRQASFDSLTPRPGQVIGDIGCGNGLMTAELARAVGPQGMVMGIDPSADMLAAAKERLAQADNVRLLEGSAEALPVEDASLDGAVSLQVFEYVPDIRKALAEVARVLKPSGRLVIGDMHFGTLAWFSEVPDRMKRMAESWERHVADVATPVSLIPAMRATGYEVEAVDVLPMVDTELRPDGLAMMMLVLMENFAVSNGHVSAEEARAWADEQHALATEGRFFQSLNHFVIRARRL